MGLGCYDETRRASFKGLPDVRGHCGYEKRCVVVELDEMFRLIDRTVGRARDEPSRIHADLRLGLHVILRRPFGDVSASGAWRLVVSIFTSCRFPFIRPR